MRRRRTRQNPRGFSLGGFNVRGIVGQLTTAAVDGVQIIAGKGAARFVRRKVGGHMEKPWGDGSIVGSAVELGIGLAGSIGLRRVSPRFANNFLLGSVVSVEEGLIKSMGIASVTAALGDDDGLGGIYDLGDIELPAGAGSMPQLGGGMGGVYDLGGVESAGWES